MANVWSRESKGEKGVIEGEGVELEGARMKYKVEARRLQELEWSEEWRGRWRGRRVGYSKGEGDFRWWSNR